MSEYTIHLDTAICQLTPLEYDLFQRHCVYGEPLVPMARTMNWSPETMLQTFCRLRQQLQTLLMQTGFNRGEAMDCLYRALTAHR